jgi:hypothetical protein
LCSHFLRSSSVVGYRSATPVYLGGIAAYWRAVRGSVRQLLLPPNPPPSKEVDALGIWWFDGRDQLPRRHPRLRLHFHKRYEDEGAVEHLGMRNGQVWFVHNFVAVKQEIQVDQPRSPALSRLPAYLLLDLFESRVQLGGRQRGFDLNDGIQEVWLRGADGVGLVNRGLGDYFNPAFL